MKKSYYSTRQYLPILSVFFVLLALFAAITIYRWQVPQSSIGGKQVKVTYDYGDYQKKKTVKVGYLDAPENPRKEGYSFEGWYRTIDGEAVEWDFSKDEIIEDTILTAQWSLVPYKLTLNLNGGTCNKDFIYFYMDQPLNLPVPTKEGYYFAGWYLGDTKVSENATENAIAFASSGTVTAKFNMDPLYAKTTTAEGSSKTKDQLVSINTRYFHDSTEKLVNDGGVDRIVDKDTHTVKAVCQLGSVLVQLCFKKFKLNSFLLSEFFEGRNIIWLGVKKSDLHAKLRSVFLCD